jgi:hypothetical protein
MGKVRRWVGTAVGTPARQPAPSSTSSRATRATTLTRGGSSWRWTHIPATTTSSIATAGCACPCRTPALAIGTGLDQWPCGNFPDQYWYIPNGGNPGVIVNYHSNACISVPDASTLALVQLDQWTCDYGVYLDQTWNPFLPQVVIGGARHATTEGAR